MKYDNIHNMNMHSYGTKKQCLVGFILSLILTIIPFGIVMKGFFLDKNIMCLTIVLCAIAQIIVHLVFFLHMSTKVEDGWSIMAMIFTIIMVAICFVGSMWVMYHLNNNMMSMEGMRSIH
ncbi:cytochrome o ubiquinol oxidase subunit IV [Candidatus Liberibacter asiaticus]|uniref:Cytochrome bo(3) ubiquinol oxidase subunit 4 n=2 Tax=Liberibacter asiaticus TaxID=34021 RepID=C6XEZ2_LIBAP|nr:cytochrome o ubiquinol oxidase subunit IV [Candidatus Liberibacter asiaticus]ACT56944.1 cytochrome o ubiquinol oxidase subunit IV [Candidatus Liberibacter asiaticus str. psy62]AGH16708.1 cytochrome o ubiquinol oxidase subunit IV [Candidatus Liberibacter asiaticus str. gxpsy]ALK07086.1 cytochrome o ubiquinol oxidase subunit IV [Candidatus Liberibacter asiaticus]ASK52558.1 cytochrome o ubiquinol oxidase subunit IV [Candidatus Liberibacter asiaticus]AWL13883.1 cytochrome o ubiquinol oxidase su